MRIAEIERQCHRTISIVSTEEGHTLAKSHSQDQSLLFALPREIRDLIWAFATAPIEDDNHKYESNEYYCRPGHHARHKTFTDLLRTCRRVWLEANAMPMLQAEHCFWYQRAAPDCRTPEWMAGLTANNRRNFGHLHLFAQMYAIEGLEGHMGALRSYFLKTPLAPGDFQPRMLHVTIRHTDWWNWEDEQPLYFEDGWFKAMLDSPDLRSTQTLKFELETLDYKVSQLMPIVERLKRLESREEQTHLIDGKWATTKFVLAGEDEVYTWTGPTVLDGHEYHPYRGKTSLNYHVIMLTWHLRFPSIPGAHVPTLRRAPRAGLVGCSARSESSAYDDPLPTRHYGRAPPALRQMTRTVRRRLANGKYGSKWTDQPHRYHVAGSSYWNVLEEQKWRADCWVIGESNRLRGIEAGPVREKWASVWREKGSLLRFE